MNIARLTPTAKLPTRKNPTDVGLDLYADLPETRLMWQPGGVYIVNTGITIEIPQGYFGWITNKSRSNYIIGGGIIDEGYQGELLIKVINPTDSIIVIENGQAIAQLLILPCKILDIEEMPLDKIHKEKTARGITGGIVNEFRVMDWTPEGPLELNPDSTAAQWKRR